MVAAACLPALGGVAVVLALLAMASPVLPPRSLPAAMAALCIVALLLAGAALATGGRAIAATRTREGVARERKVRTP